MFDLNFTHAGYKNLLQLLKKQYHCKFFDTVLCDEINNIKAALLLRHDVDFSSHSALEMATIESQENVTATYFILPDTQFYNMFESSNQKNIKEILHLGHKIGLHFDLGSYGHLSKQDILTKIKEYKEIMELLFNTTITSISYHNPFIQGMEKLDRSLLINGLINCYSEKLAQKFHYRSDSMCNFRDKDLVNNILQGKYENLQLLIHPEWWTSKEMTRDEKMEMIIRHRSNSFESYYIDLKQEYTEKEKI